MNRYLFVFCALVTITSTYLWRIFGGQDAVEGQFPYQISLRGDGSHICAGSIITNRWILTAAHCVDGWPIKRLSIAVGTIILNDPQARIYQFERTIIHNDWDDWTKINDIGLIRVSEDIEFNYNVQPVLLNTEDIGGVAVLILSGWGRISYPGDDPSTDILQWILLISLTVEKCRSKHWNNVYDSQICTCTLTQHGKGACLGDYGGPLVQNGRQVGIVSYQMPCVLGYPGIYTRVASFTDWINQQIAESDNN